MMPTYYNPHSYSVHLFGPNGVMTTVKGKTSVELDQSYDHYVARGYICRKDQPAVRVPTPPPTQPRKSVIQEREARVIKPGSWKSVAVNASLQRPTQRPPQQRVVTRTPTKVVGKADGDATVAFREALATDSYPISNGVGVGVLSYNRPGALRRLIESIERHTDLNRTTVFVSDDGSTDPKLRSYLSELAASGKFVIIRNERRLGVAGNCNRLLRCLSRFNHFLLLNDDVEVIKRGWDTFYRDASQRCGYHHFSFRQAGIYGAEAGKQVFDGIELSVVQDKPHGAILSGTHRLLQEVGYFDEGYGLYGMEHVDWSSKAGEFGLQPAGYFDVSGSAKYFRMYQEPSAVQDRLTLLDSARKRFAARKPVYCHPSDNTALPSISVVMPFRDFERTAAITTVVNNVRASRFPVVQLLLCEQDGSKKYKPDGPCIHLLIEGAGLFNKSKAFNVGVHSSAHDHLVLHDADTICQGGYLEDVFVALKQHDSCFLNGKVVYATQESSKAIEASGAVSESTLCDRVVGYFEGGSSAIRKSSYWAIGGHYEEFKGYGCEDCNFYLRMSKGTNFLERRNRHLLHLWHSRVPGWHDHHEVNKRLEAELKAMPLNKHVQICREDVKKKYAGINLP